MAKAEVLAPINTNFENQVQKLAVDGKALAKSYADLTDRMLRFAGQFNALWERAKALDNDAENGHHRKFLRETLEAAIDTANKSIRSRWIKIGEHSKELLAFKKSLPPQRDSLYELALALDDKKPLEQWIQKSAITAESSVREIRSLRGSKRRPLSKGKPSKKAVSKFPAPVTLHFESFDKAFSVLKDLIVSDEPFKISKSKALEDTLKALEKTDYENAKNRLV